MSQVPQAAYDIYWAETERLRPPPTSPHQFVDCLGNTAGQSRTATSTAHQPRRARSRSLG